MLVAMRRGYGYLFGSLVSVGVHGDMGAGLVVLRWRAFRAVAMIPVVLNPLFLGVLLLSNVTF